MSDAITFKEFRTKMKALNKIKAEFLACQANTNFKPAPITQHKTYYPCDELNLGDIMQLIIDGFTNSEAKLSDECATSLNEGYINGESERFFKKLTHLVTSRMMPQEYYLSINTHKIPLKIKNALYDYENQLSGLNSYHKNEVKRHILRQFYNEMLSEADAKAFAMFKGHNTELELVNYLAQNIESEDLYIYQNVHIGNYEHDCILLCNKVFLTLEIKDHITNMNWDDDGKFTENIHGIRYDKCQDPYQQTINHERSFNELVGSDLIEGVVVLANDDAMYGTMNDEIAVRIVRPKQLVTEINDMPDSFNHEHIVKIDEIVEHLKQDVNPKFALPDLKRIDELFMTLIDVLCLDTDIEYDQNKEHISTHLLEGSDIIDDSVAGGKAECRKILNTFNSKRHLYIKEIDKSLLDGAIPQARNAVIWMLIIIYFIKMLSYTKYYYPTLIQWIVCLLTFNVLYKLIKLGLNALYSIVLNLHNFEYDKRLSTGS